MTKSKTGDERPPQISAPGAANSATKRRWVPPSSVKRETQNPEERNHATFRRVRGILNKLAPEKFDKLSLELLNVGIDSDVVLKGIILLIFEKALDEPKYSSLYAQLCHRLCEDAPNFEPASSNISTFRRLLLNKCQDEFENRSRATEVFNKDGPLTPDEAEQFAIAKHKMLGNIKFIGELGKLQMLHEGILHKCIKQLLEKKKNVQVADMGEDLECLCQIMRTVGPRLDHDKARAWMDQYFMRMKSFMMNPELPSRIRFMLQDCVELRENRWSPRKGQSYIGPRTIQQVREEAAKDMGVYFPPPDAHGRPQRGGIQMFPGGRGMNGVAFGRGGMADVFGMPPGFLVQDDEDIFLRSPGSGGIGTGPGVIPMDGFTPGYSANMGRQRNQQNQGYQGNYRGNRPHRGRNSPQGRGDEEEQESRSSPNTQRREPQNFKNYNKQPYNKQQNFSQQNFETQQNYQNQNFRAGQAQQAAQRNLPPRLMKKQMQQQQQLDGSGGGGSGGGGGGNMMQGSPPMQTRMEHGHPVNTPSPPPPHLHTSRQDNSSPTPPSQMMNSKNEEISLRPANFTSFRPAMPSMLPKSAQPPPPSAMPVPKPSQMNEPAVIPNPILQKQAQITIKHTPSVPKEKEKPHRKAPTKDELKQATESLLKEYLENKSVDKAVVAVKDMRAPKKYMPELITYLMVNTLGNSDMDREDISNLITTMKKDNLLAADHFMDGFTALLEQMSELETEHPLVKSYVSKFAAKAVADDIVSLSELADPMRNGAYYPLFLLCLQQLYKIKSKEWLTKVFQESKMDLLNMLPECDRNKDRMMEILEDRGLSFMFPLLRVQNELYKQILKDPNPNSVYKWIKESLDSKLHTDPGFINALVSSVLRYITSETSLKDGIDVTVVPDKAMQEKEKDMLEKYKGMLQIFLHEHIDLQIVAIYALQVECYNNSFPKGMLLRMFMYLYDQEVIDEEAFLKWKEEVNDQYPGKGKALFQVNQWLTWLEQAEEESEDEGEE